MDVASKSWGFWVVRAGDPSGQNCVITGMTANGAGNGRWVIYQIAPGTSGFRIRFEAFWSGNDGAWRSDDITSTVRHHLAFTYDRSGAAPGNDPVFYLDGTSITVTETGTPTGTADTGDDTLKCGENAGGGEDLAATVQHAVIDAGTLWSGAQVNRARWWGRPGGGMLAYYPLVTAKLANEAATSATLTATGTTVTSFSTPVVRPSSAMMGMGIGW